MSASLIHDLHAGISRRDWSAVEAASNRLRDDVQQTISTLAGTGIGSLPNDYPLPRLAERLEADRQERVEQCERMANDWAEFCETMGVTWDAQEAVAAKLEARGSKQRALIETLTAALEASVTAIDDWLNIFAEELCDPERVTEAKARTGEFGTLWYIATTQQANREAIAAAKEQSA